MTRLITQAIRRTRSAITVVCALAIMLLVAFGAATTTAAADAAVAIDGLAFTPLALTVPVGTRVVWTNQQPGAPYTVTSDTGVFDSGTLQTGDTYAFTFNQSGVFAYHCTFHPTMHGAVTVVAAGTAVQSQGAPITILGAGTPGAPTAVIPNGLPRTGGGGEALREGRNPANLFMSALALVIMFVSINVFVSKRVRR